MPKNRFDIMDKCLGTGILNIYCILTCLYRDTHGGLRWFSSRRCVPWLAESLILTPSFGTEDNTFIISYSQAVFHRHSAYQVRPRDRHTIARLPYSHRFICINIICWRALATLSQGIYMLYNQLRSYIRPASWLSPTWQRSN